MAESETSICNKALTSLGANTIINMTDKTPEGRLCNEHYDACRDAVLEDVDWSFAVQTTTFASPITTVPSPSPLAQQAPVDYKYAFLIPSDLLRVISVNKNDEMWEIQGNHILSDSNSINVKAVYRVEDPSLFSPRFIEALVYYLASNLALPITESPARMEMCLSRYAFEVKKAQANDGRQGRNQRRRTYLLR